MAWKIVKIGDSILILTYALTAILFVMDQSGYEQKDLAALIGKSRASDVLNKKRSLSMKQARILYKEWGVPAETLLVG